MAEYIEKKRNTNKTARVRIYYDSLITATFLFVNKYDY